MRILANENVPGPVVMELRHRGHDVVWVKEAMVGAADHDVLARAEREARLVVTFDKERLVPTLIKYYRERLNNLVRLRQDESFVMVGARPRPQKITITDYTDNTTTTYDIVWTEADTLPAPLFDEKTFATAEVPWRADVATTH